MDTEEKPVLLLVSFEGYAADIAFCRSNGDADYEAETYLSNLSPSDRKKFGVRLQMLAARGHINNTEQFNDEGNGIWFIKIDGHRLACFKTNHRWILITSGHKKQPKDRSRKQQVDHAIAIRDEYLKNTKEP